jgi:hypothetical protein
MHIGTPFKDGKMENEWISQSAVMIGIGPFAAPSFVRCYCIRSCRIDYSHTMLSSHESSV